MKKILAAVLVTGALIGGYAFAQGVGDGGKNLQVLPKTMSKNDIKKTMKLMSKALGVQCEFCHDKNDFSKDGNEHKDAARAMMKMTMDLNQKYFGGKQRVTCMTCHNGKSEPK